MPHCLTVLPDSMLIDACLDHETMAGTADLLGVSWPFVAAELKRRGLGTHHQIRRAHGLETPRRRRTNSPAPKALMMAVAEGRVSLGGKSLGTDLRCNLPGVKL